MNDATMMRDNAGICLKLAERAGSEPARLRYMRMAAAWQDLADNQDWLDGASKRNRRLEARLQHAA